MRDQERNRKKITTKEEETELYTQGRENKQETGKTYDHWKEKANSKIQNRIQNMTKGRRNYKIKEMTKLKPQTITTHQHNTSTILCNCFMPKIFFTEVKWQLCMTSSSHTTVPYQNDSSLVVTMPLSVSNIITLEPCVEWRYYCTCTICCYKYMKAEGGPEVRVSFFEPLNYKMLKGYFWLFHPITPKLTAFPCFNSVNIILWSSPSTANKWSYHRKIIMFSFDCYF